MAGIVRAGGIFQIRGFAVKKLTQVILPSKGALRSTVFRASGSELSLLVDGPELSLLVHLRSLRPGGSNRGQTRSGNLTLRLAHLLGRDIEDQLPTYQA